MIEVAPELPLQTEFGRREIIGKTQVLPLFGAGLHHDDGLLGLDSLGHPEPSIFRPFDRQKQHLPSQAAEPFLVSVSCHPPTSIGRFHKTPVSNGHPAVEVGGGMRDGIEGRILPRSVRVLTACGNDHVTCRRTSRATFGYCEIKVFSTLKEL